MHVIGRSGHFCRHQRRRVLSDFSRTNRDSVFGKRRKVEIILLYTDPRLVHDASNVRLHGATVEEMSSNLASTEAVEAQNTSQAALHAFQVRKRTETHAPHVLPFSSSDLQELGRE
jgi:hypothetical protein